MFEKINFQCPEKECEKTFSTTKYFKAHKLSHTDKALICTVDGMKFITKQDLQRHMIIHSGEQPFQCAVCGNKFRQPTNFRSHVKTVHKNIHEMIRAKQCEYCGTAQSSVVNLHHHLLKEHTEKVKHKMEIYFTNLQSKKYKRHNTLSKHNIAIIDAMTDKLKQEEIELPIKCIENIPFKEAIPKLDEPAEEVSKNIPEHDIEHEFQPGEGLVKGVDWDKAPSDHRFYTCEKCGKTFSWKFEILFHGLCHLRDDQGQAMNKSCPECETTFKTAVDLRHHLISHTKEIPFICLHCGKLLASQTDLRGHIEVLHFLPPEQKPVVEAMKGDAKLLWEDTEEKRKEVVLVEGIKEELEVKRKQVILMKGKGKTFRFTGPWR